MSSKKKIMKNTMYKTITVSIHKFNLIYYYTQYGIHIFINYFALLYKLKPKIT